MSRILILYASQSGNTEVLAQSIATYLKDLQHDITVKNFDFDQISADEIKQYDATLIGIYTWDYGEIPFEVEFFYDELDEVDLSGCICGVFGAGDSFYGETFGLAVDLIYEKLAEHGALLHSKRLKVDLTPEEEDLVRCEEMANGILSLINQKANRVVK